MIDLLIIGYGKLGSHLHHALKLTPEVNIIGIVKRPVQNDFTKLVNQSNVIFVCVQDSKITSVVKKLLTKKVSLNKSIIFHTSGSLSSDKLTPLNTKGAFIGSFHPVQTFEAKTKMNKDRFKDIYIAIEGDLKAKYTGAKIAKYLHCRSFNLNKQDKVYHHICCVIISNFLSTIVRQIEKLGSKKIRINGFKNLSFFNIYTPLAATTLTNIAKSGAIRSLSGPVERNDIDTISAHLNALRAHQIDLLPIYVMLGIETVKLALEKKSISLPQANKIMKIFSKHIKNNNIK